MDKVIKKTNGNNISNFEFGKVPPQAKELEEAILGAIMMDKSAYETASEIINEGCFYVDQHRMIFECFAAMAQKSMLIDPLTVMEEMRKRDQLDLIGGPYTLTQLTKKVVRISHIETHCRVVLQKFIQRELIRIGSEIVANSYEDSADVFELLDQAESNVMSLSLNFMSKEYSHISAPLMDMVKRIEHLKTIDESITGVHSGFEVLDSITHGWQPTDLIILAARPSVGKTAFALNLAKNAAINQIKPVPVGFFSLEMSAMQLTTRITSMQSGIFLTLLKTGKIDEYQTKVLYEKGVTPLSSSPIYIDDSASLTLLELRAKARRMKNKHGVGLIVIDYLQLMDGDHKSRNGNREQEISRLSRGLKKLAKELEIPIIALSQLSREIEKRGNRMPQLSDLRESGAIEQDADLVMFLYRPSKEDILQDAELETIGFAGISKHRNGELADLVFEVNNSLQRWNEKGKLNNDLPKPMKPLNNYEGYNNDSPFDKD